MLNAETLTLLHRAREGDSQAMGQLFDGYSGYLLLLARVQISRRLQMKADPSDVVQETLLDACRQFAHFRGTSEGELLAWLRRILAGQIASTVRRYLGTKGRDLALERELAIQLDQSSQAMDRGFAASTSTPSHRASRREQAVILADALDHLSEDHREVIVLRHLEQLSFPEVAARMSRSEDSVQKLWVRALGSLRQSLGGGAA